MDNLYYIENCGCDDTTHGLAIIPEDQFETFKNIITDLNKNSTYGCMPTIEVYKIDESMIRETTEEDLDCEVLYLGEKKYALSVKPWELSQEARII